jgi:hypothetical protein
MKFQLAMSNSSITVGEVCTLVHAVANSQATCHIAHIAVNSAYLSGFLTSAYQRHGENFPPARKSEGFKIPFFWFFGNIANILLPIYLGYGNMG